MPLMGETTYGPGGVNVTTAASGLGAAPYAGMDVMGRLIAKRLADYEKDRAFMENERKLESKARQKGRQHAPTAVNVGMRPNDQMLRAAAQKAALAQARAQYEGAPQKLTTLPGMTTGYFQAPELMSGAQRQAFLPQDTAFVPPMAAFGPSQMDRWSAERGGLPLPSPGEDIYSRRA